VHLKKPDTMKRLLIILFLTYLCGISKGQTFEDLLNHPLSKLQFQADDAISQGNLPKAIEIYNEIISNADTLEKFELFAYTRALINRSLLQFELGANEAALEGMTKVIQLDPEDLRSYISRGEILMEIGDFSGAEKDFMFILEKENKGEQAVGAYYYLAIISLEQNEPLKAIDFMSSALALAPNDMEILFMRAYVYDNLMEFDKSISDYDKLIELDSNYAGFYANRGTAKVNIYVNKYVLKGEENKRLKRSACRDLRRAKRMGYQNLDDLLWLYCK
jgi:tetratricopeptide (TPR) repeat protein